MFVKYTMYILQDNFSGISITINIFYLSDNG